jgi:hypothetical protein
VGGPGWGSRRTRRSVRGDTNHAQIWAAFASPRTTQPKYVGPLGWVFPSPGQNRTESDGHGPFASSRWRCPYTPFFNNKIRLARYLTKEKLQSSPKLQGFFRMVCKLLLSNQNRLRKAWILGYKPFYIKDP